MIKVALKHWIYEKCIDVLFKGISRNFMIPEQKFKVGDCYFQIYAYANFKYYSFYDCKILQAGMNYIEIEYERICPYGDKPKELNRIYTVEVMSSPAKVILNTQYIIRSPRMRYEIWI